MESSDRIYALAERQEEELRIARRKMRTTVLAGIVLLLVCIGLLVQGIYQRNSSEARLLEAFDTAQKAAAQATYERRTLTTLVRQACSVPDAIDDNQTALCSQAETILSAPIDVNLFNGSDVKTAECKDNTLTITLTTGRIVRVANSSACHSP